MPQTQQRMYSFTVEGWRWTADGQKDRVGRASVVATSHEEAIAECREILDPDDRLHEWAIVAAGELNPAEAKDWIRWHKTASSPLGRAEAETIQD